MKAALKEKVWKPQNFMVVVEEPLCVWDVVQDRYQFAASFTLPQRLAAGSFIAAVRSSEIDFVGFMRRVLTIVEQELNCKNYHLRVTPWRLVGGSSQQHKRGQLVAPLDEAEMMEHARAAGFYITVHGDPTR